MKRIQVLVSLLVCCLSSFSAAAQQTYMCPTPSQIKTSLSQCYRSGLSQHKYFCPVTSVPGPWAPTHGDFSGSSYLMVESVQPLTQAALDNAIAHLQLIAQWSSNKVSTSTAYLYCKMEYRNADQSMQADYSTWGVLKNESCHYTANPAKPFICTTNV